MLASRASCPLPTSGPDSPFARLVSIALTEIRKQGHGAGVGIGDRAETWNCLQRGGGGSRSALRLEMARTACQSPTLQQTHDHILGISKSVGKRLRQIFPVASVPCPPRPLGGAARAPSVGSAGARAG